MQRLDVKTGTPAVAGMGRDAARDARRAAIEEAAKTVFFEDGYGGASMDRIAELAGVTKRTVYAHFDSKDALFAHVVALGCANVLAQLPPAESLPTANPRAGLAHLLSRTHELMLSPGCLRLERVVAAEAERHPAFAAQLAAAFQGGENRLAGYLGACVRAGSLKDQDVRVAARLLSDATGRAATFRGMLGAAGGEDERALSEATLSRLLDAYLALHGR